MRIGDLVVRTGKTVGHSERGSSGEAHYVAHGVSYIVREISEGGTRVRLHGVAGSWDSKNFDVVADHHPAPGPAPSPASPASAPVTLDPLDPFDAVLIDIVLTNRAKRHDYTTKGSSAWENFDIAEERLARRYGIDRETIRGAAVDMMLFTKDTRLDSITSRGGVAKNESSEDTVLDEAVYSIIRYGRLKYPDGVVAPD